MSLVPYGKKRPLSLSAQAAGFQAGKALRLGYNIYKRYKRYKQTTGVPQRATQRWTNDDFSSRNLYRRRRMPRRKKYRWKKFQRKVTAALYKKIGLRAFQGTVVAADKTSSNGTQVVWDNVLYGANGTAGTGWDDMKDLIDNDDSINAYNKIQLDSAVLDVTFHNAGENSAEIDVYKFVTRKAFDAGTLTALYTEQTNANVDIGVTVTGLSQNRIWWTPFDTPGASKFARIMSVRKYVVGAGQTVTLQLREKLNKTILASDITNEAQCNIPFFTKGFLAIAKGITTAAATACPAVTIASVTARKYHYRLLENSENADGYI